MSDEAPVTGRCLCGDIRYQYTGNAPVRTGPRETQ